MLGTALICLMNKFFKRTKNKLKVQTINNIGLKFILHEKKIDVKRKKIIKNLISVSVKSTAIK